MGWQFIFPYGRDSSRPGGRSTWLAGRDESRPYEGRSPRAKKKHTQRGEWSKEGPSGGRKDVLHNRRYLGDGVPQTGSRLYMPMPAKKTSFRGTLGFLFFGVPFLGVGEEFAEGAQDYGWFGAGGSTAMTG